MYFEQVLKCCGPPYLNEDFTCAAGCRHGDTPKKATLGDASTTVAVAVRWNDPDARKCVAEMSFSIRVIDPFCDRLHISPEVISSSNRPLLDRRYVSAIFESGSPEEKIPSLRHLCLLPSTMTAAIWVSCLCQVCLSNVLNIEAPPPAISSRLGQRTAAAKRSHLRCAGSTWRRKREQQGNNGANVPNFPKFVVVCVVFVCWCVSLRVAVGPLGSQLQRNTDQ